MVIGRNTTADVATRLRVWGGVVVLPENRLAVAAARRLAGRIGDPSKKRTANASVVVLHGPNGTGKSAIAGQLVEYVVRGPRINTAQILPARELPGSESRRESGRKQPDAKSESVVIQDPLADLIAVDLLVIEDVQELAPRDFASLILLHDRRFVYRRPTLFTSTTAPADLHSFPRRLTNRLSAGLVVRIDPPSVRSLRKLSEYHAGRRKLKLSPELLDWLAARSDGTRSLLGMLERIRLLAANDAGTIEMKAAREWLEDGHVGPRADFLDRLLQKVCMLYHVTPQDVRGESRLRSLLLPRQIAMYLAKEQGGRSFSRIGAYFGGRDHTTVMHAVKKITAEMNADAKLNRIVRELRAELRD